MVPNRPLRLAGIPLLVAALAGPLQAATVWYVDTAATGNNTGTSWPNAFTDLQSALDVAQGGHEIWVAAGTYKPSKRTDPTAPRSATFRLVPGVALFGGFTGNESSRGDRDWANRASILDGDLAGDDAIDPYQHENCYHVVSHNTPGEAAVLDGMVIRGGAYQGGEIDSCGDHRIAMSFAMAALKASGPITIHDCANVATSFPGFVKLARRSGLRIRENR